VTTIVAGALVGALFFVAIVATLAGWLRDYMDSRAERDHNPEE
jgi:hypothetical protein